MLQSGGCLVPRDVGRSWCGTSSAPLDAGRNKAGRSGVPHYTDSAENIYFVSSESSTKESLQHKKRRCRA